MNRWQEIGGAAHGGVYDDRWRRMEERGEWAHGEAGLVSWFEPASVLDAGCATARRSIFEWLTRYNTTRRHTSLGCLTPDQYEAHYRHTAGTTPALST